MSEDGEWKGNMAHEFNASVMENLIRELYNIPPDVVAAATDAIAEGAK